jgi:hypothetical protein
MPGRTIIPRTGRHRARKIDLGEEFDAIAGPHRAGFHDVLPGIAGESGAHEDSQHAMHTAFRQMQRLAGFRPSLRMGVYRQNCAWPAFMSQRTPAFRPPRRLSRPEAIGA